MFFRIVRSYGPIFNIYRFDTKSTAKYTKYLFVNFQFEHNSRRYFLTCLPLSNKQLVQENVKQNNNNNKEISQLETTNDKSVHEQSSEESDKEQQDEVSQEEKRQEKKDRRNLIRSEKFEDNFGFDISDESSKEKNTFLECLRIYEKSPQRRTDVVNFVQVAMRYMEEFGVHKDLECYKKLLDLFPKDKMIPRNFFQTMFMHYAREQYTATSLLDQMERNSVIPDVETEDILLNTFGSDGMPTQKYWRMMYWMPKFKNLNPWPVPHPIPDDAFELAKLAMVKISSVDVRSTIAVFDTAEVEDAIEKTWIVSAMAPKQSELLTKHEKRVPIFVEGPFRIYVAVKSVDYFVLKAKTNKNKIYPEYDPDAVDKIRNPYLEINQAVILPPSVHEQVDATIFAVCATGTSSQDSLLSWVRCLQKKNPVLGEIPIVFTLRNSTQEKFYIESGKREISDSSKKNDDNELLQG